jgi:hypothetical protein
MSWSIELRVSFILGAPEAREGRDGIWREPERVDDTKVLKPTFGAGFAKKVLRDSEASCSLRRCERSLVVVFLLRRHGRADHRLTKILVLP